MEQTVTFKTTEETPSGRSKDINNQLSKDRRKRKPDISYHYMDYFINSNGDLSVTYYLRRNLMDCNSKRYITNGGEDSSIKES